MRYFYDTEFLDNGTIIDFISIGIVDEDGFEYYAVNADADWDAINAHPWLPDNVVAQLPPKDEWKSKAQIRDEVKAFLLVGTRPELWAWFAAYDHVVLSQLFGRMLDLPKGIPMYTHDLRAYLDYIPKTKIPAQPSGQHDALQDAHHVRRVFNFVTGKQS
jgi:3' exoribonuclease, RNase T-like